MAEVSQSEIAYRRALLRAVGMAPTLDQARTAFAVLDQTMRPFPARFSEQMRTDLAQIMYDNPQTHLFAATAPWFERGDFFEELGWAALTQKCTGIVGPWLQHPRVKTLAQGPSSIAFLDRFLSAPTDGKTTVMLMNLVLDACAWSQAGLDRSLANIVQAQAAQKWDDAWFGVWNKLLHRGANPLAPYNPTQIKRPGGLLDANYKNAPPNPGSIAWALAQKAGTLPSVSATLLAGLVDHGHANDLLAMNEGKFASLWLKQGGPRPVMVDLLQKSTTRWWDGDPFGLLKYVVLDHANNTTLFVAMHSAATRLGIDAGLPPGNELGVFTGLFRGSLSLLNSPDPAEGARILGAFWQVQAPQLSVLWKDPTPWVKLCDHVGDYLSQSRNLTIDAGVAWLQATLLSQSTRPSQGKSLPSRRSI